MSLVLRAKYESGFISFILSKATSLRLHSAVITCLMKLSQLNFQTKCNLNIYLSVFESGFELLVHVNRSGLLIFCLSLSSDAVGEGRRSPIATLKLSSDE